MWEKRIITAALFSALTVFALLPTYAYAEALYSSGKSLQNLYDLYQEQEIADHRKTDAESTSRKNVEYHFLYGPVLSGHDERTSPEKGSNAVNREYALLSADDDKTKEQALGMFFEKYGFNSAVQKRLDLYKSKYKRTIQSRLEHSGRYSGAMAWIFRNKGLPQELAFLPIIESGYDPFARSHMSAVGPWQFMPYTARHYGLKIDWWVDERRDPLKSTEAAANYLQDLYEKFDSWNLALAAYNAGEGKVRRALRKTGTRDYWQIRKTRLLRKETRNYVPSYIASTAIAIHPEQFGFENIDYYTPFRFDLVTVDTPIALELVASLTASKTSEIRLLNPELRRSSTPPNVSHYTLRIPEGTRELYLANFEEIRDEYPAFVNLYTVRKGDTLGKIAKKIGTSIKSLLDINSLGKKALIFAGKTILLPFEKSAELLKGKHSKLYNDL
jgi:membrane-bound lytic murein transglycosylase D